MEPRVVHRCMAFETEQEAREFVKQRGGGVILYPFGKTAFEHFAACDQNGYPTDSLVVTWNEVVRA